MASASDAAPVPVGAREVIKGWPGRAHIATKTDLYWRFTEDTQFAAADVFDAASAVLVTDST
jgi:hypothetical protein